MRELVPALRKSAAIDGYEDSYMTSKAIFLLAPILAFQAATAWADDGLTWGVRQDGEGIVVAYEMPQTDDQRLFFSCDFASKSLTVRIPFFKEGMKDNAVTTAKFSSSGGQADVSMKLISDEMGNHFEATTTLSPALQAVLRKGKSLTLRVEGETQNFPLAAGQKGFAVLAQRCGG
ncbi:MAG: hypothetical protein C0458_24295 [Methylobacterium sp.]|jgi:hypothetical protein|nr:hypothetical protein [Methylobacterium sp.]